MSKHLELLEINVEEAVLRFLSPNGLMYAVGLIFFTVVLFSGSGIEYRTMDGPVASEYQSAASPLLASTK